MSTWIMTDGHLVPYTKVNMPQRPTESLIADLRRRIAIPWLMTEAADRLEQLAAICTDMAEFDLCDLDHHGYCQAHRWLHTDPPCPHLRARTVL